MRSMKRKLAIVLTMVMVITLIPLTSFDSFAQKKTRISKKKITLVVGQKKKLKVKNKPKNAKVKWKSKNKKIAKVSKKGKVKAISVGKTKIIAKVGKKKYKCKVIVKKNEIPEVPTVTEKIIKPKKTTPKKKPSAVETTTKVPETPAATTKAPETVAPTTKVPTTVAPTTKVPTTVAPTTKAPTTAAPTTKTPTTQPQTTTQFTFTLDTSIPKPSGEVVTNPSSGIIRVVWGVGAGNPNCYNVYIDGVRKKTKVAAASYDIPVSTEGNHLVEITHVNPNNNTESERTSVSIYVSGTAQEEVETTAIPEDQMPQIDHSVQKQNGKMILQLNNKTNNQYADNKIYWIVIGRNPSTHKIAYVDTSGNLIEASLSDNDATIGNRSYSGKIVHTLAESRFVQLPAIESGRLYLSYGEPVYITFNGNAENIGYAGPDVNNESDANRNTLFEYLEFTTEAIDGGIKFHGNTTRVDFFSFPMITRLTDEYGAYDRCVGDLGTRSEIFSAYTNEVSDKFDALVTNKRIMCPAKLSFSENGQYSGYFDDYINRFWSKYANEDLVITGEAGNFTGRTSGNRLILSNSQGTYYIDKPTTQDVFEGRGAFNRVSTENSGSDDASRFRAGRETAIEALLCAAFTRGVALDPSKWWDVSSYYTGSDPHNEYAAFFHRHSVSGRAYGFCYDDVNDQSTLVECENAERFTIDLRW